MQRLRMIPLCALLMAISACDEDMSDLEHFIQQTKQSHPGKAEPLPVFPPYESFRYQSGNIRDPFKPQTDKATVVLSRHQNKNSTPGPQNSRKRQPLERFPIDSLKMVGLLQQRNQIWALVRDPEGTIHRVQPGHYAGQNHGKVTRVSETKIDIIELVPDGLSGWLNRRAQLAMAED